MPLARLAQYQHCLLRRNGVRVAFSSQSERGDARAELGKLRLEFGIEKSGAES
jgi:hypothetical protein